MSSQHFTYYEYTPSKVAAGVFCLLFACSTILHSYQLLRSRAWYLIPLWIGGCAEAIGYLGRGISASQAPNYSLTPYIVQSILLLIAPALFAASIYMMFGYLILVTDGEKHSLIREKWLTKIFVIGDILSFLIQSTGASTLAKGGSNSQTTGKYIIVGGLLTQLFFFGFFMVCSLLFFKRVRKEPTSRSESAEIPWRKHLWIIYTVSVLIMIRSVFRLVEYLQGQHGYLLSTEVWMYVFDATLMCLVVYTLNFCHPSEMRNMLNGRKAMRIFRSRSVPDLRSGEKGSTSSDENVMSQSAAV